MLVELMKACLPENKYSDFDKTEPGSALKSISKTE